MHSFYSFTYFIRFNIEVPNQLLKIKNETKFLNDAASGKFPPITKKLIIRLLDRADRRVDVYPANEAAVIRHSRHNSEPPNARNLKVLESHDHTDWKNWCEVILAWDSSQTDNFDWEVRYKCKNEDDSMYRPASGLYLSKEVRQVYKVTDLNPNTMYYFQVRSILYGVCGRPTTVKKTTRREPVITPISREAECSRVLEIDINDSATDGKVSSAGLRKRSLPESIIDCRPNLLPAKYGDSCSSSTYRYVNQGIKIPTIIDMSESGPASVRNSHNYTVDQEAVWPKCMFCPGDKHAEIVFNCGHFIMCDSCFIEKVEIKESKCYVCFETVVRVIKIDTIPQSRSCMLNFKGCTKEREVAFNCGCFKYCRNCSEHLHFCFEHRMNLQVGDKIAVKEFNLVKGRS